MAAGRTLQCRMHALLQHGSTQNAGVQGACTVLTSLAGVLGPGRICFGCVMQSSRKFRSLQVCRLTVTLPVHSQGFQSNYLAGLAVAGFVCEPGK